MFSLISQNFSYKFKNLTDIKCRAEGFYKTAAIIKMLADQIAQFRDKDSINKSYLIYSKISVTFGCGCDTGKQTSFNSNIF